MKNFEGEKGIGLTERQARDFLQSSLSTLILGTTDDDGSPMIHPVWYYFDDEQTKIYFYTEPALKKARNIGRSEKVYFDVDNDKWPYKGVKGKGVARLIDTKEEALARAAKIVSKYVKKDRPLGRAVLERVKAGGYVVYEITPAYFTSWDYGKYAEGAGKSILDDVNS